jgi:hypothetical protein
VISPVYLLDAVVEIGFIAGQIASRPRKEDAGA